MLKLDLRFDVFDALRLQLQLQEGKGPRIPIIVAACKALAVQCTFYVYTLVLYVVSFSIQ